MSVPFYRNPLRIGHLQVRNRIVFPAMSTKYAAPDDTVTDRLLQYYEARARGGAGLVVVEGTCVDPSGTAFSRGLGIYSDAHLPGLTALASRITRHGAGAVLQVYHGGRAAMPSRSGTAVRLVSYVPGLTPYDNSRVLDEEDIYHLADCFGQAAARARAAGFDAVELHGAHGYLLSQFVSPLTNRRTDAWGGSLENRMRFPLAVLRSVRRHVGDAFPVLYRLSAVEGVPGGVELEESVALCQRLVDEGVDALNVSVGLRETSFIIGPPACVPKGWNAPLARAVREGVNRRVPVIVAGRVVDEATAQGIVDRGDADMVVMGRALIAEPRLPEMLAAGDTASITRCISCNEGCVVGAATGAGIGCALNPLAGAEARYDLSPAPTRRRVVVVGGGPAGMHAALAARLRGHEVDLYEKGAALGGVLHVACKPPYKEDLQTITATLSHRLHQAGVRVHLGTALDADAVRALGADQVLVATGSVPVFPAFCRAAPNTVTAHDLLAGRREAGPRVLILGGGLIGCETADFLSAQGRVVTVLEMRSEFAADMEGRTRRYLMERLRARGVGFMPDTSVVDISPAGLVRVRGADGAERVLDPFDTVAVAVGYRAENGLAVALEAAGVACVRVGDCATVGKIQTAVESGFRAGLAVQ